MKRPWVVALVLFSFCVVFVGTWYALYPSDSDPRSLQYVLWKRGLYPLDIETALSTMIGDPSRDNLVIGKSKDQLRARFGFLTPIASASEYDQIAYRDLHLEKTNHEIFVLRRSTWIVVFSSGWASDLILVKGN